MVKKYKIKEILHSGRKAERGLPVQDNKYEHVVGYNCFFNKEDIIVGLPFIFLFLYNPEYMWWGMSNVVSVKDNSSDNELVVETLNSIYVFKEIEDFMPNEEQKHALNIIMEQIKALSSTGGVK